mgnify:FL=1
MLNTNNNSARTLIGTYLCKATGTLIYSAYAHLDGSVDMWAGFLGVELTKDEWNGSMCMGLVIRSDTKPF